LDCDSAGPSDWTNIAGHAPQRLEGCVHHSGPGATRGFIPRMYSVLAMPSLGGGSTPLRHWRNDRMSTSIIRRGTPLIAAATISLVAMLATASQAGAETFYACVKKGGAARVYANKPKCRHGESRRSWNSSGPAGKNGKNGTNGANGKNGTNGTNGQNLTSQTPLVTGQSESGAFAVGDGTSTEGYPGTGISFAQPLSGPIPEGHVVYNVVNTTSIHCPAVGHADAGYVCLYESEAVGMTFYVARDFALGTDAADPFGFALFFETKATKGYAAGVWTVTSP
jgi:hypothetical protein